MNKSILVIDTPDCCRECPLCSEDHMTYRDYCRITDKHIWTMDKPDWCPLKPLPEKYEIDKIKCSDPFYEFEFEYGYNQCIDEIVGGNYETLCKRN